MHPAYPHLAQREEPRHPMRDIGAGSVLLIAIVLGFLFLPTLPGENSLGDPAVGAAPPAARHLAPNLESDPR